MYTTFTVLMALARGISDSYLLLDLDLPCFLAQLLDLLPTNSMISEFVCQSSFNTQKLLGT